MSETFVTDTDVLIVGSGFSGLCMGATLEKSGNTDYVVLERASSVGGTWRDNVYPGAACDIPSHLYSYSFRPNPEWSRVYAPQGEILEYLQNTAEDEGVLPHVLFDADMLAAHWDQATTSWHVRSTLGLHRCRTLISASGHLSDPSYPDIPGLDTFGGLTFHSARWDASANLAGKRIGVIGTGASAIQIVPQLAGDAEHLTVFQRSAPYVIPRIDRAFTSAEKRMFQRMPAVAQEMRDELFWGNESRFPQRRQIPAFVEQIRDRAERHLEDQVPDLELRAKLTPDYMIGCKRILIANDYYPTLMRDNVDLETAAIVEITPEGILTADGRLIELDVLVVATGFEATDLPIAHRVTGREGQSLADAWLGGGLAFHCTTVAGFPNLFVMLGPNTGLGAGSMVFMIETQANYIAEATAFLSELGGSVEPEAQAQAAYVGSIAARAEGTVWLDGGCKSWYVHPESGRLTTLWPDFMSQFRAENGSFDTEGYLVVAGAPVGERV